MLSAFYYHIHEDLSRFRFPLEGPHALNNGMFMKHIMSFAQRASTPENGGMMYLHSQ
jgi:hypothetical protein